VCVGGGEGWEGGCRSSARVRGDARGRDMFREAQRSKAARSVKEALHERAGRGVPQALREREAMGVAVACKGKPAERAARLVRHTIDLG
jgi:hypothetical protein